MPKCIKSDNPCIGRDCKEICSFTNIQICCREEIQEERDIVQSILDAIDDFSRDTTKIQTICSKLSYGAHVINKNEDEELSEFFDIVKRFSLLMHEFQDKVINDKTISDLSCSFTTELQKWFSYRFFEDLNPFSQPAQLPSINADIHTMEMALGVCMIDSCCDDSFDDLFF